MAAGHGGQVLASAVAAALVGTAGLRDLGEHTFDGLDAPERVYQVGAATFPPLRSLGAVVSNLPVQRSAFIGRRRELATVADMVRSARLVTLTGVGGVGKTRLAVQTAAALVGEFPGGVWLVELAPLIDSALVATTVASALGLSVAGGVDPTEAVGRFLAHRRALVVMDNCEHVVGAAAALLDRVLAAGPGVRVLATSRESLDIAGESAWRVPSLSVEGDADALALFADRAAHAQPGFSLDDPAIKEAATTVCRRLDGIPLAIELAAARAKVLSVDHIAAHLDERFRLLTRGGRTAVARQQTLQGAIEWSYELLSSEEQGFFDTLGVFAGEFDLDAVVAVAIRDDLEALDMAAQLVNKSMVEVDPSRDRYRLLETLRQYACERLVRTDRLGEVRDAHAACYSALAAQQARRMVESGQSVAVLDRLEADSDNLRTALAWLIEQRRADAAARMMRHLSGLFNVRHPREGLSWCQQVVAIGGELPAKVRARLLADAAWAAWYAGDFEASARYGDDAVEVGGDETPARTYWILGNVAFVAGDHAQAVAHFQRAILDDGSQQRTRSEAMAKGMLALVRAELGEVAEARRLATDAIDLAERLGEPTLLVATYDTVAAALARIGSATEAMTVWEQGLGHLDAAGPILACVYRSSYTLRLNDPHEAARILGVAIPIAKDQLSGLHQAQPLLPAATIAAATGRQRIAAQLLGAFNHYGAGMATLRVGRESEHLTSRLEERLGVAIVDDELARGARLTIAEALQLAEDIVNATT